METNGPDYVKIFSDIISEKFPEKSFSCKHFLEKEKLSSLEVIALNRILFQEGETSNEHKSYDDESIVQILKYQTITKKPNTEIALQFGLSRNTVATWKKKYSKKQ